MNEDALRLPKAFDEVTEVTLMPEDWYDMKLVKPPATMPNGALKEWMKDNEVNAKTTAELYEVANQAKGYQSSRGQYAGLNWVLNLRVEHPSKMFNGRSFRVYLGIPTEGDADRVNPLGQTVEDSKMERIQKHLEAFRGPVDGTAASAELAPGDMARFYVRTQYNDYSQRDENTIDIGSDPEAVA